MVKTESAPEVKAPAKAPATPIEALKAAPTVFEVLGHPEFYEKWYDGMRREALNG